LKDLNNVYIVRVFIRRFDRQYENVQRKFMIDSLNIYNIYSLGVIRLVKCITKFKLNVLLGSKNDSYNYNIYLVLKTILFQKDSVFYS